MIRRIFVFSCVLAVLPTAALSQQQRHTLVVLNFDSAGVEHSFEHLLDAVSTSLERRLSDYKDILELVERRDLRDVLEEIEYQYDHFESFDSTTIARLELVGANEAVIGKITQHEGEVQVDVKMVEIKSSRILAVDQRIVPQDRLVQLSGVKVLMDRMGSCLVQRITDDTSCGQQVDSVEVFGAVSGVDGFIGEAKITTSIGELVYSEQETGRYSFYVSIREIELADDSMGAFHLS